MFTSQSTIVKRVSADVVVVPFWSFKNKAKEAVSLKEISDDLVISSALVGFEGKLGEIRVVYRHSPAEKIVLLLGLGNEEEINADSVRKVYGILTTFCNKEKWSSVNVVLPSVSKLNRIPASTFVECLAEGVLSANYLLPRYGNFSKEKRSQIENLSLYGLVPAVAEPIFKRIQNIYQGVYLTRDLVNGNADDVTPGFLADTAKALGKSFPKLNVTVLDKKFINEKMGLFSAVAKGASVPPKFIIMKYEGRPRSKDVSVFIGKGITYDTGGLDLKPGKAMLTMKEDMAGGATVLGIMQAVCTLDVKANIIGIIPATENAIGAAAYKQGDVYVSYSGDSVEIGSTDAEGRLVLADAISYAVQNFHPARIIDFATLTGAMVISLGEDIAGMFCNNDAMADFLLNSSLTTGEAVWRLPLYAGYDKALKSDIADMKNIGSNRSGAITAALFLQRFVKDTAWAHFDIAGTAYHNESDDYLPKYATGFGVRLITSYIMDILAS